MRRFTVISLIALLHVLSSALSSWAQDVSNADHPAVTMFPHPDSDRWWLSGQLNVIFQAHGPFRSPYQGPRSLSAVAEHATSRVWTVFSGVRLGRWTELLFDVESAGGRGISDALGLAGFTNLDVVRNPDLGAAPYVARVMVHVTIPVGGTGETVHAASRGPLALAADVPARRLEIRAGKLSVVDFFDLNSVGSDSHLQFTNWTIDNNGAFDYAADTRGYTYGMLAEYDAPSWSLRFCEALMPTVANGITFDWDMTRARGENAELELRPRESLVVRLLAYDNHANMGSYREALAAFASGADPMPDIEAHRRQGRVKYGAGGNVEYTLRGGVRGFARAGWNSGDTESFAYTEVNETVSIGGDIAGSRWRRRGDRVGVAFVSDGLSQPHRAYLRAGGLGFLLGDGTLSYGREQILESYYTAHVWRGLFGSIGAQFIDHPGYNRDRGPVALLAARVHVDF